MKTNAVFYARFSREEELQNNKKIACYCRCAHNDGISLPQQMKYMQNEMVNRGISKDVISFYAEYGSGITAKRKELLRLLKDVKKGNISEIYVKSPCRLARNGLLCYRILKYFKKYDVKLVNLQESAIRPQDEELLHYFVDFYRIS